MFKFGLLLLVTVAVSAQNNNGGHGYAPPPTTQPPRQGQRPIPSQPPHLGGGGEEHGGIDFPGQGTHQQAGRAGINGPCSQDSDCNTGVPDSYCRDNTHCACREGFVAIHNNAKCAAIAKREGDRCEDEPQCTEGLKIGAQCTSGVCKCTQNYHFSDIDNNAQCFKTKKIGDQCDVVNECTSSPSKSKVSCDSNSRQCQCVPPYKPNADQTLCSGGAMLGSLMTLVVASLLSKFVQ